MTKTVVLFGANGLIGRGVAQELIDAGFRVCLSDVSRAPTLQLDRDDATLYISADITDRLGVVDVLQTAKNRFGTVHAVINLAYPKPEGWGTHVSDLSYEQFCDAVNLHLGGYFLVLRESCALLAENGGGCVVSFASIYGTLAPDFGLYDDDVPPTPVEYAAIKAGIIQMTRYFAKLHRKDGVCVNSISPGGVENDHPIEFRDKYSARCGKIGMLSAQDLAHPLLYLILHGNAVTGQNLIIDDGFGL